MPPADVAVDADVVRGLLRQFASADRRRASQPIRPAGDGWDNACFRLGADLLVRVPRRAVAVPLLLNEVRWLPVLAPRLRVAAPEVVFLGEPTATIPWPWTVCRWVPGEVVTALPVQQRHGLADGLAEVFLALHRPADPAAPANPFRGVALARRRDVRTRILDRADLDVPAATWDDALAAPPYAGPPLWLHGDPHPANLVHVGGRLGGMIDFGDVCQGDPASDLAMAWCIFDAPDRARFRAILDTSGRYDADVWTRAAGWAASFASAMEPGTPLFPVARHTARQLRADRS